MEEVTELQNEDIKEVLKELQKFIKTLSDTEEEHLSQSYIKEKKLEESKYKRSDSRTDDEDDSDRITIPSKKECLNEVTDRENEIQELK